MEMISLSRRNFLKASGLTAGGLMLGWQLPAFAKNPNDDTGFDLNAYLQITEQGVIKIIAPNPEVGQGIKTALPMIIAEELEAAWQDVQVEQGAINKDLYVRQNAGGSNSIRESWTRLRTAGATAKAMLIAAAAKKWQVDISECQAKDSKITHMPSKRTFTYAELADDASQITPPSTKEVELKDRQDFSLIGKRIGGVDNHALVTGKPLFGIDKHPEGCVYATYVKCPRLGGIPKSANLDEIKQLSGIVDAFIIQGGKSLKRLQHGIAIVANSSWQAFKAKQQLKVEWDYSEALSDSLSGLQKQAAKLNKKAEGSKTLLKQGDASKALTKAAKTISASYSYPFLTHATLEPMNCTAWLQGDKLTVWAPAQVPENGKKEAASVAGIPVENVDFNITRIGGGFGRRLSSDYVAEAVSIAAKVNGPVHYISTREEDTTHDNYRPGGFINFNGGVNQQGQITAWQEHFITFSSNKKARGATGRATPEFPAPLLDNYQLSQTILKADIPTGAYRAPSSNAVAFPIQSFLHELSSLAGRDHLEFLLEILGDSQWLKPGNVRSLHTGRAAGLLKLVAEKGNWSKPKAKGIGRGIAFYFSHATPVAELVEVSVDDNKKITIHNVIVAADAGPIINLSGAEAQCQGAVLDALSSTIGQEITFENGTIQQTNFHDYPLQRIKGTPNVEVHFIESDFPPSGLGEPALPPFAPALCNAIYDATGVRVRDLPLSKSGYSI